MATTKIWAIKDSLSRVVNYAENPEKTIFSDLKQVLKYAENDEKTIDKDEKMMYVTGVNCNRKRAYQEMSVVQKRFDKTTGNIAYHAYQSFKTGEVSPEIAHEIGVKLAKEMWSEYQVLVATHFNTGTYHNHFVINSVNMFTGKKFDCNKGACYIINDDYNRKYATIRSINDKKAVRLKTLGDEYTPENITERVESNPLLETRFIYGLYASKEKE